jgi:hypothetical protein
MERQIGALRHSVPNSWHSLNLNSSYAMHHTVVKAFKGTRNLKLLHPHSNWIFNPNITEGLICTAQGHGSIKQQCHRIFCSFGITQIHIKLCALPNGYGFHPTFNHCTVYEYVYCGKVFCLHLHPMHPV